MKDQRFFATQLGRAIGAALISGLFFLPTASFAQTSPEPNKKPESRLEPDLAQKIDRAAGEVLKSTGVPSASIAVVQNGEIVYLHAYGTANLAEKKPATSAMRYSIGSISKQFTAAAILLLAEEGKLSLDDPVGRWLPDLTRAQEVTLRQILSMTSGYQDFWPQDYVMPPMMKPSSAEQIVDGWAKKPLDFEPGTKWQYSNTNYVIAGMIAEKVAGQPLYDFLGAHVFQPLEMKSVYNSDLAALPGDQPMRYQRFGLGPPRPAPKEGKGWMFAAGELAMTAEDLAKWDISMIDQKVLKPESYAEMQKAELLKNGASTQYGLGVDVSLVNSHRLIAHGGEVSGFTAENEVYPDDRIAVVVLTNLDATRASQELARKIAALLFAPKGDAGSLAQAKKIFTDLQSGKVERNLFTSNANAYFSEQALSDLGHSLGPLGNPTGFSEISEGLRGGMTFRRFKAECGKLTLGITTYTMPDGKLEQFIVAAL